jgi:glyoxylase-like metal-dependent hydrolase (beta-lactamase superfamily II)
VIVKAIPVGITQTNCYLVGCEDTSEGLVVDPGAQGSAIISAIERAGLAIKYVINTHGHFDHIGANTEVLEATGALLAMHADDLPMFRLGGGAAFFGLPATPSRDPDLHLEEGQAIEVGNLSFSVLHTPGHSPGSVTLYEREQGVAFDGDVLFAGGVGRADLPGGNFNTLMCSIRDGLYELPDETVVYPGHGPATTIGRERRSNPWVR